MSTTFSTSETLNGVARVAQQWSSQREDRQRRTQGDPADFETLGRLGVPFLSVPEEFGGLWKNPAESSQPICRMVRTLAQGDPSITLASAMHQLVLSSWRTNRVSEQYAEAWAKQRQEVFQTVHDGAWWGTMISEPGSGGDSSISTSEAIPEGRNSLLYKMSGRKHFGSGSGLTTYMITRSVPQGESEPALFYLKVGGEPWDGSTGIKLTAEWQGHGMMSTNSHAFELTNFPATRLAIPGSELDASPAAGGLSHMVFTSVIVGIVDAAVEHVRARIKGQGSKLRAFQQVEWINAEQEVWLIEQAWEGGMREFQKEDASARTFLLAKECVASLAESVLNRLCKITGGSSYTKYSPLGFWLEDVRALGFLRPPWTLAYDHMYDLNLKELGLEEN